MKFLITLLKKLFQRKKLVIDRIEESIWEHLDGAEFFVVFPKPKPTPNTD